MSCGVSMERYDRGEQENLVLKIFRFKRIFWHTLKAQKPKKLKIFKICRVGYRCKDMVQGSSFKYIFKFVCTYRISNEGSKCKNVKIRRVGYKSVNQENILRPKRCILLQNQKVCWLLTYHDSFISTLQIYAQKKEYKRYHSNFYHIDSTLTPHRLSTVLTPGGL